MGQMSKKNYSYTFLIPAALIYGILFLLPTILSFFFSMTWWTLTDWEFIGFENFMTFFKEPSLKIGFKNTLLYAFLTSGLKVVFGLLLGTFLSSKIKTKGFLRSMIFFPNLLSNVAVGIAFASMMHPSKGIINAGLSAIGIKGPDWLGDPRIALLSVILVDVWRGVGIATVIYIAGIMSIPRQYYEALMIDGGNKWQSFLHITVPLSRPAMNTVIILSLIGGLRSFDLIWVLTKGGPGFTTDLLASIVYKQYSAGFYGLSTAGNVMLFIAVAIIAFPLYMFLTKSEVDL